MKIEVRIEEGVTEPKLVIIADRMTDELSDLVRRLSGGEVTALAGFRGASAVIWQIEKWSLLRQTVTHLAIISAVTFPIAYLMHWMEHSVGGVLGYMALTFAIYAVIWAAILLRIHRRIKRLNAEIRK